MGGGSSSLVINVVLYVILVVLVAVVLFFVVWVVGVVFGGCKQHVARNYGGKVEVDLPDNCGFVNVTWKGDGLWVLSRVKGSKQYRFSEYSSFGVLQGEVVINEK